MRGSLKVEREPGIGRFRVEFEPDGGWYDSAQEDRFLRRFRQQAQDTLHELAVRSDDVDGLPTGLRRWSITTCRECGGQALQTGVVKRIVEYLDDFEADGVRATETVTGWDISVECGTPDCGYADGEPFCP